MIPDYAALQHPQGSAVGLSHATTACAARTEVPGVSSGALAMISSGSVIHGVPILALGLDGGYGQPATYAPGEHWQLARKASAGGGCQRQDLHLGSSEARRSGWKFKLHQMQKAPDASGLQVMVALDAAPLPSKARILPSLMSERIWIEKPMLPVPVASSPGDVPKAGEEPEAAVEALPAAPEVMASPEDLPRDEPGKPKQGRPRAKSPDDLPRGERWKRRLPRAAW
jgi:hypothetical protein